MLGELDVWRGCGVRHGGESQHVREDGVPPRQDPLLDERAMQVGHVYVLLLPDRIRSRIWIGRW